MNCKVGNQIIQEWGTILLCCLSSSIIRRSSAFGPILMPDAAMILSTLVALFMNNISTSPPFTREMSPQLIYQYLLRDLECCCLIGDQVLLVHPPQYMYPSKYVCWHLSGMIFSELYPTNNFWMDRDTHSMNCTASLW